MIALSPKRLKNKALCSKHFQPQDFISRKLSKSAIPISFLNENQPSSSASTTYSRMCSAVTSEEKEDKVYYLTPPRPTDTSLDMECEIPDVPKEIYSLLRGNGEHRIGTLRQPYF